MTPALREALAYHPHPGAWLLAFTMIGVYVWALRTLGPRYAPGRPPASRNQIIFYGLGVAALFLGGEWPIHRLAEDYLLSVHMLEHLVFQLIAPPLLILGTPAWLWRRMLSPKPIQAVMKVITQAIPALVIVNAFIVFSLIPNVVNAMVTNEFTHLGMHTALVLVSFIMWWPVMSPLPELPHLSYPGRMAYLFGQSIIPTVPASFITFSSTPLYPVYTTFPQLSQWLDPIQDQQFAGVVLKIGAGFFLWIVIAALFFRWQHEEETGGPDLFYWRDLKSDLAYAEQSSQ